MIEPEVLFEDNHCLAVNKPAGLLSQGDRSGEPSLVDVVAHYLKTRYAKPGNVFVGLLHRLDRPASGVDGAGQDQQSGSPALGAISGGTIAKLYWAIVAGIPAEDAGHLDRRARRKTAVLNRASAAAERDDRGGKEASVDVPGPRSMARPARSSSSSRAPGRSHQLRVQLASRGIPDPRRYQIWLKGPAERRSTAGCGSRLHAAADHVHASRLAGKRSRLSCRSRQTGPSLARLAGARLRLQ